MDVGRPSMPWDPGTAAATCDRCGGSLPFNGPGDLHMCRPCLDDECKVVCPHCGALTRGDGSHCQVCYKKMGEEVPTWP